MPPLLSRNTIGEDVACGAGLGACIVVWFLGTRLSVIVSDPPGGARAAIPDNGSR